jgi:hypothetical protein
MSGDRNQQFTDEYVHSQARKHRCDVLYASDTTLLIDLDDNEAYNTFLDQLELLEDLGTDWFSGYDILASRNGNKHAVVRLSEPMPLIERLLLQACLGSDRKRELLSYVGMLRGQPRPSLLFRPKVFGELTTSEPLLLTAGSAAVEHIG